MKNRNQSLDALRGFAILTMILSGSIAFGDVLPAWMYHAQVPPPNHIFIPAIAGISWVDLVFPFFLFSMGAAIPLALQIKVKEKAGFLSIFSVAGRRYLLLCFFALFTHHLTPSSIAAIPTAANYLLSMAAFVLLFFQLYNNKNEKYIRLFSGLKLLAYLLAVVLLYLLPFNKDGKGFTLYNSDIIIILLANMAFFGTIIWWLTKNKPWVRIGILPFIMAIFLAAGEPVDGWAKSLFNFNQLAGFHFDWLYQFDFLKYLFIIIPGTFAGEWLLQFNDVTGVKNLQRYKSHSKLIMLAAFMLVVSNIILLFGRHLLLNLVITVALLTAIYFLIKQMGIQNYPLLNRLFMSGAYCLLLGLFFEAYQGGIKKDHATFSYYFVSSGLAFFMLIVLNGLELTRMGSPINHYLSLNGKNPMVAYIAGGLLLTPLLYLTGAISIFNGMNTNAWLGFLKGVLFTTLVSLITMLFTKKGWFWKT